MFGRLFAIFLALTLAVPAHAQDFLVKKPIGRWTVYRYDNDCWMRTKLTDGTILAFSTAKDYPDLYIVLENADWSSIKTGEVYPVRVVFGTLDQEQRAYGAEKEGPVDPSIAFFLPGSQDSYIGTLQASDGIRITMKGKDLVQTALTDEGTDPALDYLRRCTASMRGGSVPSDKSGNDPFKS